MANEAEHAGEVLLQSDDGSGVRTLTLNRPDHYNALSEELLAALQGALDAAGREDSVRAVVLAARGRAFCAGHDLKQMRAHRDRGAAEARAYFVELFRRCGRMMLSIHRLPVPVIARVHGVATAAGCQLVAQCDLAVASENARFATSGIDFGLFCSTPAVALTRNVGRKKAFEMLMTGAFVDAAEARELGLVNRVVPAASLDAAVAELAGAIASKSAVAVRTGKALFHELTEHPALDLEAAYERAACVMADNMMAEDAAEGVDAFAAKRKPVWRDR